MSRLYKSWVPSVTGRLSFSHIGQSNSKFPTYTTNVQDQDIQYLICYQERELSDASFLFSLLQKIPVLGKRYLTESLFVCLARTRTDENGQKHEILAGRLFIVSSQQEIDDAIKATTSSQRNLRQTIVSKEGLRKFQIDYDALEEELFRYCSESVSFELRRTGETLVRYDPTKPKSDNAPQIPTEMARERYTHMISAQLYFFLKDIVHRHQHHDDKTDTILDIHYAGVDDISWRREILYQLYRKVIQYKQSNKPSTTLQSLGVLAYIEAFQEISAKYSYKLPVYYNDSLKTSLEAARAMHGMTQEKGNRVFGVFINILAIGIALIFSLTGLLELTNYSKKEISPFLLSLANLLLSYPLVVMCIMLLCAGIFSGWLRAFPFMRRGWYKDIWRFLLAFDSQKVSLFLCLLAIGLVLILLVLIL